MKSNNVKNNNVNSKFSKIKINVPLGFRFCYDWNAFVLFCTTLYDLPVIKDDRFSWLARKLNKHNKFFSDPLNIPYLELESMLQSDNWYDALKKYGKIRLYGFNNNAWFYLRCIKRFKQLNVLINAYCAMGYKKPSLSNIAEETAGKYKKFLTTGFDYTYQAAQIMPYTDAKELSSVELFLILLEQQKEINIQLAIDEFNMKK